MPRALKFYRIVLQKYSLLKSTHRARKLFPRLCQDIRPSLSSAAPPEATTTPTIKKWPTSPSPTTPAPKPNMRCVLLLYHAILLNAHKTNNPQPPHIGNNNAFLGDVFTSGPSPSPLPFQTLPGPDSTAPISCGFFRLAPGTPLDYTYSYHEMKIVVQGVFKITDGTGQSVLARKGDVLYFPSGCVTKFEVAEESGGEECVGFFCGQRETGKL